MRQQLLWICTLMLFSTMAVAACPEDPGCPFSPDNPAAFDYGSGDYSTIGDWSKVEWSRIPAERVGEVPAEKIDYGQLTMEQRLQMSTNQIAHNLEQIENLATDVNPERAREAIKLAKKADILSLGKQAQIQDGILRAPEGSLDFTGKEGWLIEIDDEGVINILKPAEVSFTSLTRADHLRLDGVGFGDVAEEIRLKLAEGTFPVHGLSLKEGILYVRQGGTAKVGDYRINAEKNEVTIYLREETTTGNYVKITDSLEIGTTAEGKVLVEPQPGNMLLRMVKREYEQDEKGNLLPERYKLVPDSRDFISFQVENGETLTVTPREKLVPLIETSGKGKSTIRTGRNMQVIIDRGTIPIVIPPHPIPPSLHSENPVPWLINSVPFELITPSDQVRVSSSNRMVFLKDGKEVFGTNQGLPISILREENMIKTKDDLKAKHPAIIFRNKDFSDDIGYKKRLLESLQEDTGPAATLLKENIITEIEHLEKGNSNEISPNMAQIVDQWLQENPQKAKKIFVFEFDGKGNAYALSGVDAGTLGLGERAFDPSTLTMEPIRGLHPLQILDHEFTHVQDEFLELDEKKLRWASAITEEVQKKEGLYAKYNELIESEFEELRKEPEYQDALKLYFAKAVIMESTPEGEKIVVDTDKAVENLRGTPNLVHVLGHHLDQKAELDSNILPQKKIFERLTYKRTLLPSYAFRDYDLSKEDDFREVSSTYTEVKREDVQHKIAAGNEFVRKITQLAYDSGKLDKVEYEYRMGKYCDTNLCGKCIIYTLTCKKE